MCAVLCVDWLKCFRQWLWWLTCMARAARWLLRLAGAVAALLPPFAIWVGGTWGADMHLAHLEESHHEGLPFYGPVTTNKPGILWADALPCTTETKMDAIKQRGTKINSSTCVSKSSTGVNTATSHRTEHPLSLNMKPSNPISSRQNQLLCLNTVPNICLD